MDYRCKKCLNAAQPFFEELQELRAKTSKMDGIIECMRLQLDRETARAERLQELLIVKLGLREHNAEL